MIVVGITKTTDPRNEFLSLKINGIEIDLLNSARSPIDYLTGNNHRLVSAPQGVFDTRFPEDVYEWWFQSP